MPEQTRPVILIYDSSADSAQPTIDAREVDDLAPPLRRNPEEPPPGNEENVLLQRLPGPIQCRELVQVLEPEAFQSVVGLLEDERVKDREQKFVPCAGRSDQALPQLPDRLKQLGLCR